MSRRVYFLEIEYSCLTITTATRETKTKSLERTRSRVQLRLMRTKHMYEANDGAKTAFSNAGARMVCKTQEMRENHNGATQRGLFYGLCGISIIVFPWQPCRPIFVPLLLPNTSRSNLAQAVRKEEACNNFSFSAYSMGTSVPVVQE